MSRVIEACRGSVNGTNTTPYLPCVYRSTNVCFPNTWTVRKSRKLGRGGSRKPPDCDSQASRGGDAGDCGE
jgi:hypothetical protein